MEINWIELFVGALIALTLTAIYSTFLQPKIDSGRARLRARSSHKKKETDARFQAIITPLAADPAEYTAYWRARIAFIIGAAASVVLLFILVQLASAVIGHLFFTVVGSGLITLGLIPIVKAVHDLNRVVNAVEIHITESRPKDLPQESPARVGACDSTPPVTGED